MDPKVVEGSCLRPLAGTPGSKQSTTDGIQSTTKTSFSVTLVRELLHQLASANFTTR